MKKMCLLFFSAAGCLLLAGTALAEQARHNTGCGLGTVLWGEKANGSVTSQTMQSTTNNTLGTQTFGITSGTLGCDQPANVATNERLMEFTSANLDNLARDIAVGHGESLDTLAELLEVPAAERGAFYFRLQTDFNGIFPDAEVSSAAVIDRIALAID